MVNLLNMLSSAEFVDGLHLGDLPTMLIVVIQVILSEEELGWSFV